MFCHKCGKEINENDKFCFYCGTPVPVKPETQNAEKKVDSAEPVERQEQAGRQKTAERQEQIRRHEPAERQVRNSGISNTAKILVCVAIICAAAAVIFAIVYTRGKSQEKADVQPTAVSQEKDTEKNIQKDEEAKSTLLPHESAKQSEETSQTPEEDLSENEVNEEPAAELVVEGLVRPSFFDGVDMDYTLPDEPSVPEYTVGAGLSNVSNVNDFYLSDEVKSMIEKNGFAVRESGGREFFSIYERNRYSLLPNFVTVDSMMHTYHLYFSYLLKNTERQYLSNTMADLSERMLEQSIAQRNVLFGTEWEEAAARNVRFFAVAAELLGRDSNLDGEDARLVQEELQKIYDAAGIDRSGILGVEEDYSQYKPRGYYEGDAALEAYFRAMMWYGRMNFAQKEEDLDRSALLITLALDENTLPLWEAAYAVTSFFAGASDDNGYYEYRPVIDAVYGEDATVQDLVGNDSAWQLFHTLTATMDPPKINSVPSMDEGEGADHAAANAGFRFMGQRFTLDAAIFQELMYSSIKKASDGSARMLPDALDIPAVMGSDEAYDILMEKGNDIFPNYEEKVNSLRIGIETASETFWSASLASRWLYTLQPLTVEKGEGWPAFMQTGEWARKDLQTFLGSYAELKHDTVLYAKQAMAEMGGDSVEEKDDRGYVEPEPVVFARLSLLTEATLSGLDGYGILDGRDKENLQHLKELSDMLRVISEKELRNERLSEDEYDIIRTYGGQIEHFWKEAYRDESDNVTTFEFPAAIITDVATDPNGSVLEIGTGAVNTIYVAVLVDGQVKIASGSVYSFYQFEQPLSQRLGDTEWRYLMGIYHSADNTSTGTRPVPEYWTDGFTVRNAN